MGFRITFIKHLFAFSIGFLFTISVAYSQCAGSDNTVTVCDKHDDIANRTFDLFANLNGLPAVGGVWSTTDAANFFALDTNTGIVDLWRINNYGVHEFTYTNNDCGESATVTINLGGYAGEDNIDGSANACSENLAVNLFGFLGSAIDGKIPDFNGVWAEVVPTGFLTNNLFNALLAGPGEYTFTYTVPDVDICAGEQSTVILEIHPAADSGQPIDLVVCTNEDLSSFTNLDLTTLLVDEDPNGTWSEGGTNQIDNLTDSVINVEEINTNFGYGTYTFTYSVFPSHPVCSIQFTEIEIIILPVLEGNLTAPNYCLGEPYDVTITYDQSILPDDEYEIAYTINSSNGINNATTTVELNNGTGTFTISPDAVPINEFVELDIVGITDPDPEEFVCPTINVPQALFLVSDPMATSTTICPDTEATIQLDNILDIAGNLSNETYDIDYTITNPDNSTTDLIVQNIDFSNGSATFNIPSINFDTDGNYNIAFEVTGSFLIDCMLSTTIEVLPIPEAIDLDIVVDNNCDATAIDVLVNAPALSDGSYTIDYEVIEQNSMAVLTDNTINFTGGFAEYEIDISTLADGNYAVNLTSTQDDTTPCRTVFDFELQENFSIGGTPEVIEAAPEQFFCLNDGNPTLENISVSASGTLSFFETNTDDVPLPLTTPLVDGEDYFILSTNPDNNCVSSSRIRVQVAFVTADVPTINNAMPILCGSDNLTLADLDVNSTNGGSIIWYSSASGGTLIDSNQTLVDGQSYFAVEQLNGFCESDMRLEVIPTVINPQSPDLSTTELSLCGLDNPTVNELIDLENAIDAEVEWFITGEGGEVLSSSELLIDDTTYYAQSYDPETGCINPNRIPVTVDLNNCDPDAYDFFIPDGFSPNSDGRNDTFFIPNIETIFPDFTLEIFNRYGNSLFKGDADNPAWDGSEGGRNTAPNGVYFYVIEFNREGFEPKQGRLYLSQ
ncbi:gliding motility-associated C-terminal domain-containing protein [Flagellimonas sp. 389]|uniref:gliding motility-associated C-terminal domain-containing protein n=1 Tax=Flagellimonas sp. 389 TaxID=2835862 RepID=UPI001BD57542|nr:gliding motility-associated C-terminal domain-containing protein [Flagellimonas sp. 389]MBS9461714.1 gliding motility-associated C-terminal domain-containing protein [Flagellimonas sp. 389]